MGQAVTIPPPGGPTPPDLDGRAGMRLLRQAPRKLHAHWESADLPLEPPLLVLRDLTRGKAELFRIGSDVAEFWFDAEPGRRYQAELQLGERVVLVSNAVLTPGDAEARDTIFPEPGPLKFS